MNDKDDTLEQEPNTADETTVFNISEFLQIQDDETGEMFYNGRPN